MPFFAAIRQDEYPATGDTQCIAVHIPAGDEYKMLLAGFLAFLTDVNSYADPESAQADGVAATFDEGYSLTNWDGCGVPPECEAMESNVILFGATAIHTIGNNLAMTIDAAQRFNSYWNQNPAANGDSFNWLVWFEIGNYKYRVTWQRTTGSGQSRFDVDAPEGNVETNTIEMYGTLAANQVTTGLFSITERGQCEISMTITGKNASSSGYLARVISVEIWRY